MHCIIASWIIIEKGIIDSITVGFGLFYSSVRMLQLRFLVIAAAAALYVVSQYCYLIHYKYT